MEIKISAADMLSILVEHGIEQSDAKAIIYDLIVGRPAPRSQQAAPARRPAAAAAGPRPASPPAVVSTEENYEESTEEEPQGIRRRRQVSFKNFGGPAEGLG